MGSRRALKQNDKTYVHCHLSTYEEEINALAKDQLVNRVVHLKDSIGLMQNVLKALRLQSEDENSNFKCNQATSHHCSLACNMLKHKSSTFDTTIQEWIVEKRKEISSLKKLLPEDSVIEDPEELVKRVGDGKFLFFQLKISPDRKLKDLIMLTGKAKKGNPWFYQIYCAPTEVQVALKKRLKESSTVVRKQGAVFGICSSTLYPDGSFVEYVGENPTSTSTYIDNLGQQEHQMDVDASHGCSSTNHGLMHSSSSSSLVPQLSPSIVRQPNDQFCKSPSNQIRDDDWTVDSQLHVAGNYDLQLPSPSKYLSEEDDIIQREENVPTSVYRGPKCDRIAEVFVKGSRMLEEGIPSIYQLEASKIWSEPNRLRWYQVGEADNSVPHKTIMLLGATGAGKSTLVNAMFNYALGVEWNDPFRFKVVPEESEVNQALSQTRHVTAYTLHHAQGFRVPYSLTVIDTPGFGDTEGVKRDEEITEIICKFLTHPETKINDINAICFVASSANSRLTQTQKYILSSVLSLFGKDVRQNIRLLATFSDGAVPPVVEACREAGFPLAEDNGTVKFSKFNNSVLYASNVGDDPVHIDEAYWNMAVKGFNSFFEDLKILPAKSLEQTRKFIRQRVEYVGKMKMFDQHLYFYLNKIWDLKMRLKAAEDDFRQYQVQKIEKNKTRGFFGSSVFGTTTRSDNQERHNNKLQAEFRRSAWEQINHTRIQMAKLFFMLSEASEELRSIGLLHTAPTFEDCVKMMFSRLEKEASNGSQDKMKILHETFQDWQRGHFFNVSLPSTISHERSKPEWIN